MGDFLKLFYNLPLEYRTEYDKLDLVLARPNLFKFKQIPEGTIKDKYGFYPKEFIMVVEHENNFKGCWQEMTKLAYFKAKLKVLITYNEPNKKDNNDVLEVLSTNFGDIIRQSNLDYPDNDFTQYVLIVGQKIENSINWDYYSFDIRGNIKII